MERPAHSAPSRLTPGDPPPRRLLVGVGLGDGDAAVLEAAARSCRDRGAVLAVSCLLATDDLLGPGGAIAEDLARRTAMVRERVTAIVGALPFDLVLDTGAAAPVLAMAAALWSADRILVGASSEPDGGAAIAEVARQAPCSVLVVRPGAVGDHIVVGTDLSSACRPALRAAADEQRWTGGATTLVHSVEAQALGTPAAGIPRVTAAAPAGDPVEAELRQQADGAGLDATVRVMTGPVNDRLRELVVELSAGLLVLGATGAARSDALLMGSTAETAVRSPPCSVLIARARHRR